MDFYFKDEIIHNLDLHKEFTRSYEQASIIRSILNLLYCPFLIWFMSLFYIPKIVYYYLLLALLFLVIHLLSNPKGGNIQYKRMLQANNNTPVHWIYSFSDEGILCTCPQNANKCEYHYSQFLRLIESEHLLLLGMKYRTCVVLDKRRLQGGTPEELIDFLLSRCPNIHRKKTQRTAFGKWSRRIFVTTLIIGTVYALINFPGYSLCNKLSGLLHNNMTYQEMAEELASLDITISQETIDQMEAYDAEYYEAYGEEYYDGNFRNAKVFDLLYWEGSGTYNEENSEWIPSTSGIYWVESEVWYVDSIYSDFLIGISAMNEELNFTNIQEDYSNADLEAGDGTVMISFDWNGQHYQMEAKYNYDWFDTDILYAVGRIIAADDCPRDLYFFNDDDCGFLLFYGDAEQVRQLEKKTDLGFSDTVTMLMGH